MGKTFKFENNEGKKFKVKFVSPCCTIENGVKHEAHGLCDNPERVKKPYIRLDKKLGKRKNKTAVIIEEFTHAFFWELPEWKVRKFSNTVAEFLRRADKLFESSN